MKNKDSIIFLLFFACMTLFGLYMAAKNDADEAKQNARKLFRMLPENQQRRLTEGHETRMDMLDAGAHRNQWDR